jgi:hypothetical protein
MALSTLRGRPRPRVTALSPVKSAVLVDGSALFLASRLHGEGAEGSPRLDYNALIDVLTREVEGLLRPMTSDDSVWVMWTAASPNNEGQTKFLDFVARELHWEVRRYFPSQAFVFEPASVFGIGGGEGTKTSRLIRFDAQIAFAMGRLANEYKIVVVSDSYSLYDPMTRISEIAENPTLAFFGRDLDPRWHSALKSDVPRFVDLEHFESELYNIPRKEEPHIGRQSVLVY